jgi:outer membrane protein insertion porin family
MARGGCRPSLVACALLGLLAWAPLRPAGAQPPELQPAPPAPPSAPEPAADSAPPAAPAPVPTSPASGPNPPALSSTEPAPEPAQPPASAPAPVGASVDYAPVPEPIVPPAEGADGESVAIRYLLERVVVRGNSRVNTSLIRSFVPLDTGHTFTVDDPEIEALRYRLLGSGWFDRVDLHLERGRERGWVVLVIAVEERSTLVFQELAFGVGWSVEGAGSKTTGEKADRAAEPYLGLALADTNFLGTGNTLGGSLLVSPDQQGVALSFTSPVVRASRWALRTRGMFVNGQEYFGGDGDDQVRVSSQCFGDEVTREELERCQIQAPAAVVDYWRANLSLGTAKDVGSFTRLSFDWRGDFVRVPPYGMPVAASEIRGRGNSPLNRQPIDFSIERYDSWVSMLSLGFEYDKRDSAILPSRGTLAGFSGDLASGLMLSDYEFVRMQANVNHWVSLPWGHVLRVGGFAGAVFGYAPFFYKFFVSDLTDLQPSRILGLNLDHRPAPNLIGALQCGDAFDNSCGTAISQMRQEELAARLDAEYTWPLARGRRKFLKNADAFVLLGIYGLADPNDLRVSVPGYQGAARLPIDLTFDLGVRLDTQMGVFQLGLAKILWLPVQ